MKLSIIAAFACLLAGCAAQPVVSTSTTTTTTSTVTPTYDNEGQDYGVVPTTSVRIAAFEAPTPLRVVGANTISTPQLRQLMQANPPPVLIDVLSGNQTVSLPGALWISEAGRGDNLNDAVQAKLAVRLAALTGGNKSRAVVFFCRSRTCWLSHNAAVRAVALGYTNVNWYRGGRDAWISAGLPMQSVSASGL
jgi:PQQ-dependent catabolism-associated CXXCW motif protein